MPNTHKVNVTNLTSSLLQDVRSPGVDNIGYEASVGSPTHSPDHVPSVYRCNTGLSLVDCFNTDLSLVDSQRDAAQPRQLGHGLLVRDLRGRGARREAAAVLPPQLPRGDRALRAQPVRGDQPQHRI